MVSSSALEHVFGTSNPLGVLLGMTPATATDRVACLVGAALLRKEAVIASDQEDDEWQGLLADVKGIRRGEVLAGLEAARIGRLAAELYEGPADLHPLIQGILRATDIARPLDSCARCEHSFGSHAWLQPCLEDGCTCQGFTRRCADCEHFLTDHAAADGKCQAKGCRCTSKAGKAKAPEASTGATSISSSAGASGALTASSGA